MHERPADQLPTTRPRIVLAHDWIVAKRGGELVLEAIAHALTPDHDLVALLTMVDRRVSLGPATDPLDRQPSFLNTLPEQCRRWSLPLYPIAVRSLSRTLARLHADRPIDLVISTSSAAIKSLATPRGVPHLCYCHAPARYIWSQRNEYAAGTSPLDRCRSVGLTLASGPYRSWDRATASRVTEFLANSNAIAARIRDAYDRDARVLHPPVRTRFFTIDPAVKRGDHWLIVSALEPYKRVDLAVRAAALSARPLVVVGDGSQRAALESLARSVCAPVRFVGRLSDQEVRDAYRSATLMLYPQVEDFGITAVEALACGTPVVARAAGGALDTVTDRVGAFFDQPTPEALARAAATITETSPDHDACRAQAERFGEDRFGEEIRQEVRRLLTRE